MLRFLFSLVVGVAAVTVATSPRQVQAQGVHIGAGPVHVDVGYPHAPRYRRAAYGYGGYSAYSGYGGYGGYRAYYPPVRGGHSDWHDTTHYDYHPGGFQPHYNHYDYVPGHYDVHHSGHWDGHH
jgi:hypothetical protein